jgi:hypothetical protein
MLKKIKLNINIPSPLNVNAQEEKIVKTSSTPIYTGEQMQKIAASYAAKGQKREFGVDIVAEIKNHPDDLWVVVRAIDANIPNDNGDYFADEELLKNVDAGGQEMPAYKTFEGCPVFSNHENDDVEKARGKVVHAKWVEETNGKGETEKYVECLLRIDREAYPALARGVEKDYICEVSMGCSVDKSVCSICGNVAESQDEYCTHIKNYKTRKYSGQVEMADGSIRVANNEDVFEINEGIKFIEISWVADGACENCKKLGIIDVDSVLDEVGHTLDKAAYNMSESLDKIQAYIDGFDVDEEKECNIVDVFDVEEFTKECEHIVEEVKSIIEPLDILAQEDNLSKEVVAELNKNAAQEDVDRLRAALAVMEDVARVILSRPESVNLERLEDLASVMADLQDTIEKLVDEGFGAVGVADLYQAQEPIPQGVADGQTATGVGTITEPQMPTSPQQQQQSYAIPAVSRDEGPGQGNIPSGQLPVAADSNNENLKNIDGYKDNLGKIKEFSTTLKNANKQGCDNMISKREEEVFDFSQKLQSILSNRIQSKQKPNSSIKLAVQADEEDGVYAVELGEDSFVGYYNDEEIQSWDINDLGPELKEELYDNPEKVASHILNEFKNVFQLEGGGELMKDKKQKEKVADKANETIDHDVTEEVLLDDAREEQYSKSVEHSNVEQQTRTVNDPEYVEETKHTTLEGNLENQKSRDEQYSQSVEHDTVEKQVSKVRDEEYSESVEGETIEKQINGDGREEKKAPLLEKDLGEESRIDDSFEEYPGYTSEDGPSGPGWGKDTPTLTGSVPGEKKALSDANFQVTAQLSKDLVSTLTDIVLGTETPPKTVIAKTQEILSSDNSVDLIQKYASQERAEEREKAEFFEKEIGLRDRILDGLAILANKHQVTEDSLKDFVETVLGDKKAEVVISKQAKKNVSKEQKTEKKQQDISKEASYRMSFRSVFAEELLPDEIDKSEIDTVNDILSSMVDEDLSPEDIFEATKVITDENGELAFILEENITQEAIADRKQRLAKRAWRNSIGKKTEIDIKQEVVDKIAEYIINENKDPEVVAIAIKNSVEAADTLQTIKEAALERLSKKEEDDTKIAEQNEDNAVEKDKNETEVDSEDGINIVAATIEEIGDINDDEFIKKAKDVLMSVLVEENNMDEEDLQLGEPQVDGDCVYAAFSANGDLEVEAQFAPGMGGGMGGGVPGGMGMGMGQQPQAMPAAAPQQTPGATVPPAPGVNPPNIPTEGEMGELDFGMEGEGMPEGMPEPMEGEEGELVPVELYIRMPSGNNIPVEMGEAGPEIPMGGMPGAEMPQAPGAGMPMAAVYRIPGDKIIKTAQKVKRCPICKTANVEFEDSVGYCKECNTPFEVKMKRDNENNELYACVEWIQPHELEEVSLEGNNQADDWWN